MDKLNMKTANIADENYKKLAELFPNAVTEVVTGYDEDGKAIIQKAIDKDILMQEINCKVVDGKEERYQFTWPDKRKAILAANSPISETLRPCKEESVGKDGTPGGFDSENLYIEGDNLDVLKLLQETYLGKIKMIYIDPPYNTGNDFVYEDDFSETTDEYLEKSGQFDKDGNRLVQNTESNGRFHTDWLNMMYPRIKLARNLLREDGIIFISIDDNEVDSLKKMCSEIFGEQNFVGCAGRITKKANNQGQYWAPNFDYLLTYTKNKLACPAFFGGMNESSYNLIETEGPRKGEKYQLVRLYMSNLDPMRGCTNQRYYIECPDGSFIIPPGEHFPKEKKDGAFISPESGKDKIWRWSYQSYLDKKDQIVLKQCKSSNVVDENGKPTTWNAFTKTYLKDVIEKSTATPNSFIEDHINQNATHELNELNIPFSFAKPSSLMEYLAQVSRVEDDDIILDFFSGSASTGHSVFNYAIHNNKKAKFILVQIPQECEQDTDAYKEGFANICEIGKERLRRAGNKIREENPLTNIEIDTGFRVLKLDSTNMKDVYYNPEEVKQNTLDGLVDNIKGDRTNEDLLFQTMLELGVPLSSKITEEIINGVTVFNVGEENFLIATFESGVTDEIVKQLAQKKPYYFVVRDSSMDSDAVAANFEQIFKTYSPDTKRKVL